MDAAALSQLSRDELLEESVRLGAALEKERKISAAVTDELRRTKENALAVQNQVEQEEEAITNRLMKRLEQLKREKQALANEVEQEEEFLTNTLQKKLDKLIREKADLETRLETEQEYVVNKLCKQLEQLSSEKTKLHKEKVEMENQLEAEQEYIMNKLQKQLEVLAGEKATLQRERSDLQRQCGELSGAVDKLNRDKVNLENQMEMEEENIVNRLTRQLEALSCSYRALEARLEARGLTLRDMGLAPHELPPENWLAFSRAASRAGSCELARASWGSRQGTSSHRDGALPSPAASGSGGMGRIHGDLMGKACLSGGSPCSSARRRERPLSGSAGGPEAGSGGSSSPAGSVGPGVRAAGASPVPQGVAIAGGSPRQIAAGPSSSGC